VHLAGLRLRIEQLNPPALVTHAAVHHPLLGAHHVVRGALAARPGVEAVRLVATGRVAHRAGYAVGRSALVGLVLTGIVGLAPEAALDHGEMLAAPGVHVEQHGIVALVQMLLPAHLAGGVTAVVV